MRPLYPRLGGSLYEAVIRFGAEIRRWRFSAGLSQEVVAARVGVHQTTISRLERGLLLYTPAVIIARIWDLLYRERGVT